MNGDVLLITSAINSPPAYLAIADVNERLIETLCGLVRWLRDTSIQTIVICDGTMPTYDFSRILEYAAKLNKKIEVLSFQESPRFFTSGKGYSEGEVLQYAITHSKFLKDGCRFYKVTGRTFVSNFDEICSLHRNDPVVFASPAGDLMPKSVSQTMYKALTYPWIYVIRHIFSLLRIGIRNLLASAKFSFENEQTVWTQFYKCDVSFFKEHLIRAYLHVNDWDNSIESQFYRSLQGIPFARFAVRPWIVGRSGGYGFVYDEDYSAADRALAESFL